MTFLPPHHPHMAAIPGLGPHALLQPHQIPQPHPNPLAREEGVPGCNLFIRGLRADASDETLRRLCEPFGPIVSAKAILDRETQSCKGYGFVMFESQESAAAALKSIQASGQNEVAYAKLSNSQSTEPPKDPTNLYFSNLPEIYGDAELHALLLPFGNIVSSRILRDFNTGASRGVGFARMENARVCETIIEKLHGRQLEGATEPLICKLADTPHVRKRSRFFVPIRPTPPPAPQMYQSAVAPVYGDYLPEPHYVPTTVYPHVVYDGRGRGRQVATMQPYIPQYFPQSVYTQLVYSSSP